MDDNLSNSENGSDQKNKEQNFEAIHGSISKIDKRVGVFALILVIVISGAIYFISTKVHQSQITNNQPIPKSQSNTPIPTQKPQRFKAIVRHESDGSKTEVFVERDRKRYDENNSVIFDWEDYLIMIRYEKDEDSEYLFPIVGSHNLVTGETHVLIDISQVIKNASIEDANALRYSSGSFGPYSIYEDTLFFSFGYARYLAKSPIYYVEYPPVSEAKILTQLNKSNSLGKIGDKYFITGGVGDSCVGRGFWNEVDIKTKQIYPQISSSSGCEYGSYMLGLDPDTNFIMSDRIEAPDDPVRGLFYGIHTNLYKLNTKTPEVRQYLLNEHEMPKNVRNITLNKDRQIVIMYSGTRFHLYDISKDTLKDFTEVPENIPPALLEMHIVNDDVCIWYSIPFENDNEPGEQYFGKLNLETGLYTPLKDKCKREATETVDFKEPDFTKEIEFQVKKLDLPENYEILYK